jgi:transitional endoplasmic reticulum ATPase
LTDGLSGADITSIVNTAVSLALQEFIAAHPNPEDAKKHVSEAVVNLKHFEDAVRKVRTSREGRPQERLALSYYR